MSEPELGTAVVTRSERVRTAVTRRRLIGAALALSAVTGGAAAYQHLDRKAEAATKTAHDTQRKLQAQSQINDRLATIVAGQAGVSKQVVEGKGLKRPEQLSGYGQQVNTADAKQLQASTVQIVTKPKGVESAPWGQNCTGLKIVDGASIFVVTARHCIQSQGYGGYPSGPNPIFAENITNRLLVDYGVQPAGNKPYLGLTAPVTKVTVSDQVDWALLQVDGGSADSEAYDRVPAMLYRPRLSYFGKQALRPGAATKVFSLPGAAQNRELTGDGVYLGTIIDPDESDRSLAIIGLRGATTPDKDACNYGASGSTPLVAGGSLLGPLSMRNNVYYAPGSGANYPDNLSQSQLYRLRIVSELSIDASEFPTLCGYAAPEGDTAGSLISAMATESLPPVLKGAAGPGK